MNCSSIIPSISIDHCEINKRRREAIMELREDHPSLSKHIKLIEKQHNVIEVAWCGEGWFDENGSFKSPEQGKPKKSYKYKIEYQNTTNREHHLMVFN